MNKKGLLLIFIAAVVALATHAQGRMDLRINEVMVQNDSNLIDSYGNHSAWIEIFNASHGSNGIEKMFITNKRQAAGKLSVNDLKDDPAFHEIRRGDAATKVAPRKHVVFYADADSARGTFHLPFALEAGKENYIALYDVNGELVDEVVVPANLPANASFARSSEEFINLHKSSRTFDASEWQVRDGKSEATAITPGKFNTRPLNENIEKFGKNDPSGIILTLIAMLIVFSALFLLFICFKLFGKAFQAAERKNTQAAAVANEATPAEHHAQTGSNDEAIAAICMALYQHMNAHDVESGILTFNHEHELHSAWGSKGNLLGQVPDHHEV